MQAHRALLCLSVVAFAAGCAAEAAPAVDLAAEEQAIRALSMEWLALDKARNPAGIAALFASDGVLFRENDEPVVGPTAIEAYVAGDFAENPNAVTTWTTDRVEVAATADLAVEYGTWSATNLGATADQNDNGKYVTTYRKVGGVWKVTADASLSTKPEEAAVTP